MGAQVFTSDANDTDPDAAFCQAVEQAAWEYGHGGYSGTIAEKDEYVVISSKPHTYEDANAKADALIDEGDPRIDNKWGPAGAIRVVDPGLKFNGWLFFGWASS